MSRQSKAIKKQSRPSAKADCLAGVKISATTRRLGERLLDQQMWCWGRDIRCEAGNLLLAYGFERQRSAEDRQVSSYTLNVAPDGQLILWGGGLFYGDPRLGGLFLKRYEFRPKFTPLTRLAAVEGQAVTMPPARLPQSPDEAACLSRLLLEALACLSCYEAWVIAVKGINYRQQTLAEWHRKAVTPPDGGAAAWQTLAATLGQTLNPEKSKYLFGAQPEGLI